MDATGNLTLKNKLTMFCSKYDTLLLFLLCEDLVFLGFNLAGISLIFELFGLIIALVSIPFAMLFTSKREWLYLLIVGVPLFLIIALLSFSSFATSVYSMLDNISYFLGALSFFFIGYALRYNLAKKWDILIYCIIGSIAALVLISFFYTMIRYEPFYVTSLVGQYIYFNGTKFLVSNECKFLFGFSFYETDVNYFTTYVTLLLSSGALLLFIKPSENKKLFMFLCCSTFLGLLVAIFMPLTKTFIFAAIIYVISVLLRFVPRKQKLIKGIKIGGIVVFCLGFLFIFSFYLNAIGTPGLSSLIASNSFLNRIYNGMDRMQSAIEAIKLSTTSLFGFGKDAGSAMTGCFLFDIIGEGSIFAFFLLIALVAIVAVGMSYFFDKRKEEKYAKVFIVLFLLSYVIYTFYKTIEEPMIHTNYFLSFFREPLTLICLFLLGYSYTTKTSEEPSFSYQEEAKKLEPQKEEATNE